MRVKQRRESGKSCRGATAWYVRVRARESGGVFVLAAGPVVSKATLTSCWHLIVQTLRRVL